MDHNHSQAFYKFLARHFAGGMQVRAQLDVLADLMHSRFVAQAFGRGGYWGAASRHRIASMLVARARTVFPERMSTGALVGDQGSPGIATCRVVCRTLRP